MKIVFVYILIYLQKVFSYIIRSRKSEKMKKKMIMLIILWSLGTLTSCSDGKLPEYESTYFKYAVETKDDGSKVGYLIGFTELGLEQTHLILPEELDGIKIRGFGYKYTKPFFVGNIFVGPDTFVSSNLKKLYINYDNADREWRDDYNYGQFPNCHAVYWKSEASLNIISPSRKEVIRSYNLYLKQKNNIYERGILANISYMYNYEGAENEGYYWVDSYNQSLIEFIPPEPQREGYTFEGWYKEEECINEWNFDVDITKEEIYPSSFYEFRDEYPGTYLYAKWNKI